MTVLKLVEAPPRNWRCVCSCKFAVRGATKGAVVLAMAGHTRRAEGRHAPSAPYPTTKRDRS